MLPALALLAAVGCEAPLDGSSAGSEDEAVKGGVSEARLSFSGVAAGYQAPAGKMGVHDQPRIGGISNTNTQAVRWSRLKSVMGSSYSQYNIWWSAFESKPGSAALPVASSFCPGGTMVPANATEKARWGFKKYHCYSSGQIAQFDRWLSLDQDSGFQSGAVIWSSPPFTRHPQCEGFPWNGGQLKEGCVPQDAFMDDYEDYVRFLAQRYNGSTTLTNGRRGKLSHFIVWNEAGSTEWTDLSPLAPRHSATAAQIQLRIDKYSDLMRRSHAALNGVTSGVMLYASTDYYWINDGTFPAGHMSTKRLIEGLWQSLGTSIPWSVAVHPYGGPKELLSGRYTFRTLSDVSNFQLQKLRERGISSGTNAPQAYLIASEQGGWSIGNAAGKARAICEAHDEAVKNPFLLAVAHNYFHQMNADPDASTFGLVPRYVNDDLGNLLDSQEGRAFVAASPSNWGKTKDHECCRSFSLGCGTGTGGGGTPAPTPAPTELISYNGSSPRLAHLLGRAEGTTWSATVYDGRGYLSYGPYATDWPSATTSVSFELAVDNNSADNAQVAAIDVYDATTGTVLAARTLTRREMAAPMTGRAFSLGISMAGRVGHKMEARVYVFGYSYVQLRRIAVLGQGGAPAPTPTPTPTPTPSGAYPMSRAESNDTLSGWVPGNAIDGNSSSSYSSNVFPTATNSRNTYLAAWTAAGGVPVSTVRLTARRFGTSVLAFPRSYNVYLTAPDNSSWVHVGSFSQQPSNGVVALDVRSGGVARRTYGVLISPTQLGADDHGSFYFQLAELGLFP